MEIKVDGQNMVTKQVVYIASNATRVFLSREACEQIGLIPENFLKIEFELNHIEINPLPNDERAKEPLCNCPKRMAPPPLPTEIPKEIAAEKGIHESLDPRKICK